MEGYRYCGDCNKHYRCVNCGADCGADGHWVEVDHGPEEQIMAILMKHSKEYMTCLFTVDREKEGN